jgi:signal transduction histidine kinase
MSLDYQPFDLGGLLQQVESLLAGMAVDKGLALELQRPEGLTEQLLGDELRIKQILVNLASNALKFTERGRIELRVIPQQVTDTALRLISR